MRIRRCETIALVLLLVPLSVGVSARSRTVSFLEKATAVAAGATAVLGGAAILGHVITEMNRETADCTPCSLCADQKRLDAIENGLDRLHDMYDPFINAYRCNSKQTLALTLEKNGISSEYCISELHRDSESLNTMLNVLHNKIRYWENAGFYTLASDARDTLAFGEHLLDDMSQLLRHLEKHQAFFELYAVVAHHRSFWQQFDDTAYSYQSILLREEIDTLKDALGEASDRYYGSFDSEAYDLIAQGRRYLSDLYAEYEIFLHEGGESYSVSRQVRL